MSVVKHKFIMEASLVEWWDQRYVHTVLGGEALPSYDSIERKAQELEIEVRLSEENDFILPKSILVFGENKEGVKASFYELMHAFSLYQDSQPGHSACCIYSPGLFYQI